MSRKLEGVRGRQLPRLFVSYAHRAPGHAQVARNLVLALRALGFACVFDQDVQPSPPDGWAAWMNSELPKADRVLVLWSSEYLDALRKGERGGARFERTLILKMVYVGRGLDRFIPCIARSSDRERIDTLWQDHETFLVPRDIPRLSAYLRGPGQRVTPRVIPGPDSKTVRLSRAPTEKPQRFVFSFAKEAVPAEIGQRLDVLEGLGRRAANGRNGSRSPAGASAFLSELVEDSPAGEPARSLELWHSSEGFALKRFPGHGRSSPRGDSIREAEVHEFLWRLRGGEPPTAAGRLFISGSKGTLLLGRIDKPPLLQIELRDLPITHSSSTDSTRSEAIHVT